MGILLGALGALVVKCAKEVNDDYQSELDDINSEIENMTYISNVKIDGYREMLEDRIEFLDECKARAVENSLDDFYEVFSKIKNVQKRDNNIALSKCIGYKKDYVSYKNNSSGSSYFLPAVTLSRLLLSGIGRGIELQYKIDEAKAEKSKVKAECKKIDIWCKQIESLTEEVRDFSEIIDELSWLTLDSVNYVDDIIRKNGTDYSKYTEHEKDAVMSMVNLAGCLSDLIFTNVFLEDGKLNPTFEKYITGAKNCIEVQKNENRC